MFNRQSESFSFTMQTMNHHLPKYVWFFLSLKKPTNDKRRKESEKNIRLSQTIISKLPNEEICFVSHFTSLPQRLQLKIYLVNALK